MKRSEPTDIKRIEKKSVADSKPEDPMNVNSRELRDLKDIKRSIFLICHTIVLIKNSQKLSKRSAQETKRITKVSIF